MTLIVLVVYDRSSSRRSHGRSTHGSLFPEAGRVDIATILVEGTGGSSAFGGDPRVPHGTFRVVFGLFQLAKVRLNLLRCALVAMTSLESIQRDSDVLGLSAPTALGLNGTECPRWLLDNSPRACVRDGQFPDGGGFRSKQPHLLSHLNGVLFVPIPASTTLEGTGELGLD